MSIHTTHTTPGTLCPPCQQPQLVTFNPHSQSLSLPTTAAHSNFLFNVVSAGTLISHEKLLLQINTEREMGNMDYKLGQVREMWKKRGRG